MSFICSDCDNLLYKAKSTSFTFIRVNCGIKSVSTVRDEASHLPGMVVCKLDARVCTVALAQCAMFSKQRP